MNKYRENIIKVMDSQSRKGMREYGMSLEENTDLTIPQRIDMLTEELVDVLFYLQHLKNGYESEK